MMRHQGFTLTELIVAVAVAGILAAASVAYFGGIVPRQRWDSARDVLVTLAAGELAYFELNNGQYLSVASTDPTAQWRQIFADNPNGSGAVTYDISVNNLLTPPAFSATATTAAFQRQCIDENRTLCGDPGRDGCTCGGSPWPRP